MVYKFGIIGLPNVGKSALFNAITKLDIPSKNFPFCTIAPNVGVVSVFDSRLKKIANCVSAINTVYSTVILIDIAGLVQGASTGEGLGNKFLEKIKECHALIQVVRFFKNNDIIHVYDNVDPSRDIGIINTELLLSDLDLCEKIIQRYIVLIKKKDIINNIVINLIQRCIRELQSGIFLKNVAFTTEELKVLKQYQFLTLKPMIYVLNMMNDIDLNVDINKFCKDNCIDISTTFPVILHNANKMISNNINDQLYKKNRCYSNSLDKNKFIKKLCDFLHLKTFFTAGPKEARSWIFQAEKTAVQVANLIHTDFSKGFIRAQIISYNDLINYRNINEIKRLGKIRSEGKKYVIQDGDIINFLFNV
ncbi:Ribosome-binding ATPase YchF [Buchnera aphidicola (Cinara kochiana kochiana)]|uniref:Ribosome-binding ATPase YchF n=1 Tax=Buchnera aphidicola (Cinara kochiana kochiana) TaxID=2518976 RepID=A0A451D5E7_9GAMM|nr:redox-regulated ATPase YchF [Buchnera aphidicola]VFP81048.1 Ribosome-binding ATPase YchF [Buchnera aphidicola (Cinara kochiana kochiana)]